MTHLRISQNRVRAITSALFLLGLAILAFTGQWWPGILLVIGISLAIQKLLMKKFLESFLLVVIFVSAFLVSYMGIDYTGFAYKIFWRVFLPIIFLLGAISTLLREFYPKKPPINKDQNKE